MMTNDDNNQSQGAPSTELIQQIQKLRDREVQMKSDIASLQQRLRDTVVERQTFEKAGRMIFGEQQFNALLNTLSLSAAPVAVVSPARFAGGGLLKVGEETTKRRLSDVWGKILAPLAKHDAFSYEDVQGVAEAVKHDLKTTTLRSQMKVFVDDGLVERIDNGKFRLTDTGKTAATDALLRAGISRPALHVSLFEDLLGDDEEKKPDIFE